MIFAAPGLDETELEAIAQIDRLRQEVRWMVAAPPRWFGGLRRLVFARAVQGSNSIEGYNASLEDVIAVVEDEEPLGTAMETRLALGGYRDAMTYVVQLADEDDLRIDGTLLRSLHFMTLKHDLTKRPGRWRPGHIFVRREPGGNVVYEAPDAELVPRLTDELLAYLDAGSGPVLVRAAMAHLNLAMIHPFSDGNGRMARCLQTLVLTRERIVAPVFSSIEEYLGRNTEAYYSVLAEVGQGSWHPERDARPWIRFCLNAHFQQAQTMLWRVREAEELWGRCHDLARERRLPERVVGPLSDAARGFRLRNSSYRIAVSDSDGHEVDVQTASRDLRSLVTAGLLEAHGETRGRYYFRAATLQDAFEDVRSRKPKSESVDLFSGDQELNRGRAS